MPENQWYPFYIGDYARKTAHLSMLQQGAYRLLLDHYYATGRPLPKDMEMLYRICRASNQHERAAVRWVSVHFFVDSEAGLTQSRVVEELDKRLRIKETNSANAKRRHSDRSAKALRKVCYPQPQPQSITNSPSIISTDTVKASDFQKVYDGGVELFPQLAAKNTSSIHAWLSAGCSVELDILPEMRRMTGTNPASWNYFTRAIMDAKATREKPPPEGIPRANGAGSKTQDWTLDDLINDAREKGILDETA